MIDRPLLIALLDPPATAWLVAVWILAMGGAVGSFLNVVVYRLPAGASLSRPGSHCPKCKHPIRWHDNVPVFGWLLLGGRCRDCGLPIAWRYPAVEAFCAAMFLAVGLLEVVFDGVNLPQRLDAFGAAQMIGDVRPLVELGLMAACHLTLLSTLLAAALIAYDGKTAPMKLYAFAAAVGVILPWAYGEGIRPVAAMYGSGALIDTAFGLSAGLLAGRIIGRLGDAPSMWAAMATLGLCLGWQAAVGIGMVTAVVVVALRVVLPQRKAVWPDIWLFAFTLAWILAWRWLPPM